MTKALGSAQLSSPSSSPSPPAPLTQCCSEIPALSWPRPTSSAGAQLIPPGCCTHIPALPLPKQAGPKAGQQHCNEGFAQQQQTVMSKHTEHNKNTARIGLESFLTFSQKQGMEICLLQGRMGLRNNKYIYCCAMQHLALLPDLRSPN